MSEDLQARIKKLEENVKNQNSYITKLESQNKDLQAAVKEASQMIDDVDLTSYVLESRARDFKKEAVESLIAKYGEAKFEAVKPDWEQWLTQHLNIKQASVPFFEQSFQMALGKALGDPEHSINKTTTTEDALTNVEGDEHVVTQATRIVEENTFANTLNGSEGGTIAPDGVSPLVDSSTNTEDALKSFRQKMRGLIAGNNTNNPF